MTYMSVNEWSVAVSKRVLYTLHDYKLIVECYTRNFEGGGYSSSAHLVHTPMQWGAMGDGVGDKAPEA